MDARVLNVSPLKNYQLEITFTDKTKGIFDCSKYLQYGIFKELKDEKYFKQVKVSDGTVAWSHGQDFCSDTLLSEAKFLK